MDSIILTVLKYAFLVVGGVLGLGVVLSLLKVYNGNFLAATRLLYAMGSRDMLGGPLGRIHPTFQTPGPAILLVGRVAHPILRDLALLVGLERAVLGVGEIVRRVLLTALAEPVEEPH